MFGSKRKAKRDAPKKSRTDAPLTEKQIKKIAKEQAGLAYVMGMIR